MFSPRLEDDKAALAKLKISSPSAWIATWFGLGLIYPAPGTWGSLGAIPLYVLSYETFGMAGWFVATVVVIGTGWWACKKFQQETGTQDSKMIVVDEVAGQMIALLPSLGDPLLMICSFLLFRFFDIKKPWPIFLVDRKFKGPGGVMMDDILAGCITALCVLGLGYARFG